MSKEMLKIFVSSFNKYHFTVDEAVQIAHDALFSNHGQSCCSGSRTYVQASIYDEFVKKAAAKARSRKVGNPFEPNIQQGPQVISLNII